MNHTSDKTTNRARQAGIYLTRTGFLDGDRNGIARFVDHHKLKDFAELVIRDTIKQMRTVANADIMSEDQTNDIVNSILY